MLLYFNSQANLKLTKHSHICIATVVLTAVHHNPAALLFQMDQFHCLICQIKSWTACKFHKVSTWRRHTIFTHKWHLIKCAAVVVFNKRKRFFLCSYFAPYWTYSDHLCCANNKISGFFFILLESLQKIDWTTAAGNGKTATIKAGMRIAALRDVIVTSSWTRNVLLWILLKTKQPNLGESFSLVSLPSNNKKKMPLCVLAQAYLIRTGKKMVAHWMVQVLLSYRQNLTGTVFHIVLLPSHPLQEWTSSTTWLFPTPRCRRHPWALEPHRPWITRSRWTWAPSQRWGGEGGEGCTLVLPLG